MLTGLGHDMKRPPCGRPFCLFLKVRGKELGRLGLRFLIHLGVVFERQVELLAELGGFGVRERVHRAGILDDPIIGLRCVEILLERVVLLTFYEGIVRAVQDEDLRLYVLGTLVPLLTLSTLISRPQNLAHYKYADISVSAHS